MKTLYMLAISFCSQFLSPYHKTLLSYQQDEFFHSSLTLNAYMFFWWPNTYKNLGFHSSVTNQKDSASFIESSEKCRRYVICLWNEFDVLKQLLYNICYCTMYMNMQNKRISSCSYRFKSELVCYNIVNRHCAQWHNGNYVPERSEVHNSNYCSSEARVIIVVITRAKRVW